MNRRPRRQHERFPAAMKRQLIPSLDATAPIEFRCQAGVTTGAEQVRVVLSNQVGATETFAGLSPSMFTTPGNTCLTLDQPTAQNSFRLTFLQPVNEGAVIAYDGTGSALDEQGRQLAASSFFAIGI